MIYLRNLWGMWICLFFLCLPFPFYFLPDFGEYLTRFLSGLTVPFVELLGREAPEFSYHSDSIIQYYQLLLLLPLGTLIIITVHRLKPEKTQDTSLILQSLASYILAFYLLKYGFDKVFKYQFYDPEPNILFTPTGKLSKDILFWSSMGSSYWYNVFMGVIEIIPGLLLLSKKTRMLGALIALGVLINVFAINIGFDISVKVLSFMLVISALFILSPHIDSLYRFFILNQPVTHQPQQHIMFKPVIYRLLKGTAIGIIFLECLLPYAQSGVFNGDRQRKSHFTGSYVVNRIDEEPMIRELNAIKRIHVHSKGYMIMEDVNGEFTDYKVRFIEGTHEMVFVNRELSVSIHKTPKAHIFTFKSSDIACSLATQKIDLSTLPLMKDTFHWTVESFK